jgi:hypothetical protein
MLQTLFPLPTKRKQRVCGCRDKGALTPLLPRMGGQSWAPQGPEEEVHAQLQARTAAGLVVVVAAVLMVMVVVVVVVGEWWQA